MGNLMTLCRPLTSSDLTPLVSPEISALKRLEEARHEVETRLKSLDRDMETLRNQAKTHIKAGERSMALVRLAQRKRRHKLAEGLTKCITTLDVVIVNIEQGITSQAVMGALQSGSQTLQKLSISQEKVDELFESLREQMESGDSILRTMGDSDALQAALNGGVPLDEDELQAELDALAAEDIRASFPLVPVAEMPSTTLPIAKQAVTTS